MKKTAIILIVLLLAAAAGYFAWDYGHRQREVTLPAADIAPAPETRPKPQPVVRYPVPQMPRPPAAEPAATPPETPPAEPAPASTEPIPVDAPLPRLNRSDDAMRGVLARFFPQQKLEELFVLDNLIKRIVVSVDTLPQKKLPARLLPIKPAPGSFEVEGEGETRFISPKNDWRYSTFVKLVDAVDTSRAASWYAYYYPLFQEAYRDLGYPRGYFNDRLVAVIDHLLATPEVAGPIPVVQHVVRYRFADPRLEALSAGQKLMIRIGKENARIIKAKLREFRRQITSLPREG